MIYAQICTYNGSQQTIASRSDQPDPSWTAYDVADAAWLYLDANGAIAIYTQAQMDAQLLTAAKTPALSEIDATAKAVDAKYTTTGGQQGSIYDAKYAQAQAYIAAGSPALADPLPTTDPNYALYGLIRGYRNSLQIATPTATDTDAANGIIATRNEWIAVIGTQREELRLVGKAQVNAATTVADVTAALNTAVSGLEAL